jgi:hypothetical protein
MSKTETKERGTGMRFQIETKTGTVAEFKRLEHALRYAAGLSDWHRVTAVKA